MSDEAMDQALNQGGPSRDIPMTAPAPTAQQDFQETLTINGKEIKASREQLKKWAEMGYNYPQKAEALNKQQQEFMTKQQQLEAQWKERESKWAPYKEVDEYAAKNPDWWTQVQQSYQQKMQGAESNADVARIKQELLAELNPVKEFMQNQITKEQNLKVQEEDSKLGQEVESIRKTYSNIDFDTPDEDGKSLEMKILKHAMDNNISSFKTAFRDFYHDHLIGKAKEEGKELVSKEIQKRTKLGILGETSKPTKGLKYAENVKDKSYSQLIEEAKSEMGF